MRNLIALLVLVACSKPEPANWYCTAADARSMCFRTERECAEIVDSGKTCSPRRLAYCIPASKEDKAPVCFGSLDTCTSVSALVCMGVE